MEGDYGSNIFYRKKGDGVRIIPGQTVAATATKKKTKPGQVCCCSGNVLRLLFFVSSKLTVEHDSNTRTSLSTR